MTIFEINQTYLDSSLKAQLMGHESTVTCFTLISKTPMLASADDKGKVKIWSIRNFKCMQTIDFGESVTITCLLDMSVCGKVGVIGSRVSVLELEASASEMPSIVSPYRVKCSSGGLWVLTNSDMRQFEWQSGRMNRIECSYHGGGEVTVMLELMRNKILVTGSEKGEICFYLGQECVQVGNWHNTPITFLE